jgi:hypothetical protein
MADPNDVSEATGISVVPESLARSVDDRRRASAVAEEERRKHSIGMTGGDEEGHHGEDAESDRRLLTTPKSIGDGDDIEALRRDISRLEGKVDALLEALEVADGDE